MSQGDRMLPPSRSNEKSTPRTMPHGDEGQRVGCRTCDVVFRERTADDLARVPCPVCGLAGEVISLPLPDTWPSDYGEEERRLKEPSVWLTETP
jgi:hypothetical protein